MKIKVEVTDTFGGDANYAWVRRYEAETKTNTRLAKIRAAKAVAGWAGIPCDVQYGHDTIVLHPKNGDCVVMFIEEE
jgi:hypothetical protein